MHNVVHPLASKVQHSHYPALGHICSSIIFLGFEQTELLFDRSADLRVVELLLHRLARISVATVHALTEQRGFGLGRGHGQRVSRLLQLWFHI